MIGIATTYSIDQFFGQTRKPRKKKVVKKTTTQNKNSGSFQDYLNQLVVDPEKYKELNRLSKEWTEENIKNQKQQYGKKHNQTNVLTYNQETNTIENVKVKQDKAPIQQVVDNVSELPGNIIKSITDIDWTKILLWGGLGLLGFLLIMMIVKK